MRCPDGHGDVWTCTRRISASRGRCCPRTAPSRTASCAPRTAQRRGHPATTHVVLGTLTATPAGTRSRWRALPAHGDSGGQGRPCPSAARAAVLSPRTGAPRWASERTHRRVDALLIVCTRDTARVHRSTEDSTRLLSDALLHTRTGHPRTGSAWTQRGTVDARVGRCEGAQVRALSAHTHLVACLSMASHGVCVWSRGTGARIDQRTLRGWGGIVRRCDVHGAVLPR